MTGLAAAPTSSSRAQDLLGVAPALRTTGSTGASGFADLLADHTRPEPVEEDTAAADVAETESPQSTLDNADVENTDATDENHSISGDQADGPAGSDDDDSEVALLAQGGAAGGAVNTTGPADAEVAPEPEPEEVRPDGLALLRRKAAEARERTHGVTFSVTKASDIDLTKLAESELAGHGNFGKQDTTGQSNLSPAAPPPRPGSGPTVPQHPSRPMGTPDAPQGANPSEPVEKPRPIFTDTQNDVKVEQTPADPTRTVRASSERIEAVRAGETGVKPADEAKPATDASAKAALLERLSNSPEARRGAVTGVDRVEGVGILRPAGTSAGSSVTGATSAKSVREAVLGPVQRGLASMMTQGGGKMTVVLRPESLGEVRLRMEAKDGVVRVRIEASTDAARKTLESGLDSLKASLESRGVRVESLHVESAPATVSNQAGGQEPNLSGDSGAGGQQQGRGQSDAGAESGYGQENDTQDQPIAITRGIWTELGIDAVA